jgi:hypothetical protein
MDDAAVLTIACGKQLYLDMASALARSFRVWHAKGQLTLHIATDAEHRFPRDVREAPEVRFIDIRNREFGEGFENKLHIDELVPAHRTLFVDADCLLTGPLGPVFETFRGHSVSAVGGEKAEGEWFGDLSTRCERFGVQSVPVFVGALYYIENDETARKIFETARQVKQDYDESGFVRLRGLPNEEPLISVGMAVHDQTPVPDDGTIKADAMHFEREMRIDVLKGTGYFRGASDNVTAWGVTEARPIIAHFNDAYAEKMPYIREQKKLENIFAGGWSRRWASVHSIVTQSIPFWTRETTKDLLRPGYRALFGTREIRNKRAN